MDTGFCQIEISKLIKAAWNYKKDDDILMDKLIENIRRNGQIENIIVRELDGGTFEVVNGNHRLDALTVLGFSDVYCYNLGKISEQTAKRIAVETNETKFQSNLDSLADLVRGIVDEFTIDDILLSSPFSEEEINQMINDIDIDINENDVDYEDVTEQEIEDDSNTINTIAGDIYYLNNHRVICGDCTDNNVVDKLFSGNKANLVVTDPPYGVDYGAKNKMLNEFQAKDGKNYGTRMEREIKNDAIDDYRKFFAGFMSIIPFAEVNSFYAFISPQNLHNLRLAFDDAGMYLSNILVWVKNQHVISWIDYMSRKEFIMYGWKGKHKFYGETNSVDVLEFDKPITSRLHPTMKPVELVKKLIKNSSVDGDIVYDAFLGSGTTLIASQDLGRTCYGCELDEKYCDVIVKRWVNYMKDNNLEYSVKLNGEEIKDKEWLS